MSNFKKKIRPAGIELFSADRQTDVHDETNRRTSKFCGSALKLNIKFNPLTPNDPYSGRTAPLTSKRCILYIYSTNIGTEHFRRGICSPFFPLQNAACFIILAYLVPVLLTFYIQCVLKLKKNSGAKRLRKLTNGGRFLNIQCGYVDTT